MARISRPASAGFPAEGTVLAERYELMRQAAEGGMGAVYEAHDRQSGRRVAVKVLHPEFTQDHDVRRRFRRECSVLRALEHPTIVEILDVSSTSEEVLYSVMELLEGETLLEVLEGGPPMVAETVVPLLRGMATGLDAAHEHGVIHGDLKPANVFVLDTPEGGAAVKLLDFGLAKVFGLERLTRTGELIGTPAYMAPELLTGKGQLDERIDTYALGVILFQCLTGRPPFRHKIPGTLMMDIVMGNAPAPTELVPDISPEVEAVVLKAMHRKRERRFESALELSGAFDRAVQA